MASKVERPAASNAALQEHEEFVAEWVAAVADSNVMEHLALALPALLELMPCMPEPVVDITGSLIQPRTGVTAFLHAFCRLSLIAATPPTQLLPAPAAAAVAAAQAQTLRRNALRSTTGACTAYMGLEQGLGTLCAMDGGIGYGALTESLALVPVPGRTDAFAATPAEATAARRPWVLLSYTALESLLNVLAFQLDPGRFRDRTAAPPLAGGGATAAGPSSAGGGAGSGEGGRANGGKAAAADADAELNRMVERVRRALSAREALDVMQRLGDLAAVSVPFMRALPDERDESEASVRTAVLLLQKLWAGLSGPTIGRPQAQQQPLGVLPTYEAGVVGFKALGLSLQVLMFDEQQLAAESPRSRERAVEAASRWWRQLALLNRHALADFDDESAPLQHGIELLRAGLTSISLETVPGTTAAGDAAPGAEARAAAWCAGGVAYALARSSSAGEAAGAAAGAGAAAAAGPQQAVPAYSLRLRLALEAGLLPDVLEAPLRAAARSPGGAQSAIVSAIARGLQPADLIAMLACAPAREAASLVATIGKALRRMFAGDRPELIDVWTLCAKTLGEIWGHLHAAGSATRAPRSSNVSDSSRITGSRVSSPGSSSSSSSGRGAAAGMASGSSGGSASGHSGQTAAAQAPAPAPTTTADATRGWLQRALVTERMTAVHAMIAKHWLPSAVSFTILTSASQLSVLARLERAQAQNAIATACGVIDCVLKWLVLLVEQCSGGAGGSSCSGGGGSRCSSGGAAGAVSGSGAAAAAGADQRDNVGEEAPGWDPQLREFILCDLSALRLIQASLRAYRVMGPHLSERREQYTAASVVMVACVSYAALAPEEWRAWLIKDLAAAAAAAGGQRPHQQPQPQPQPEPWVQCLQRALEVVVSAGSALPQLPAFQALVAMAQGWQGMAARRRRPGRQEEEAQREEEEWLQLKMQLREAVRRGREMWAGALPGGEAVRMPLEGAAARLQLPRLCSNPECAMMDGECEAERPLRACGGGCGGAAAYCCRECQVAHWKAGHKQQCGKKT
ncbi:hypothetical protein HYH02_005652 [Chlamydomonas schloesseri]|uniref:MYND-type domain-containing protein n=1 Tax=Chlamydomonas schloesseri TaxID=2026947 RepID=A0A835WLL5_9CHLO|nr:hypothetical protein HYH02_005652 [Chlamydomonas schloesseri]|eukprot:KAG2449508.1 hypothetical protein HYH02_005652 [Chlamydomonas schloesseri]